MYLSTEGGLEAMVAVFAEPDFEGTIVKIQSKHGILLTLAKKEDRFLFVERGN